MFLIVKNPHRVEWARQEAGVAVTKTGSQTLAALTCAAISLPGMQAKAATPVAEAEGNVQYGYYREQGDRMRADVACASRDCHGQSSRAG